MEMGSDRYDKIRYLYSEPWDSMFASNRAQTRPALEALDLHRLCLLWLLRTHQKSMEIRYFGFGILAPSRISCSQREPHVTVYRF